MGYVTARHPALRPQLHFAYAENHAIRVVDRVTRIISTLMGNGTAGHNCIDACIPTTTLLRGPRGIAFDGLGTIYISGAFSAPSQQNAECALLPVLDAIICDADSSNGVIRKVTGGLVFLVAGMPFSLGYSGRCYICR